MAAVPHPSLLVYVGVGALVAWRMYSRMRRVIGRQQLSNNRPWITIVVFVLLFGLLLLSSVAQPMNALALAPSAQTYAFAGQTSATGLNAVTNSPLTLVIFATLAGYYVTYAIGLLRWRRRVGGSAA